MASILHPLLCLEALHRSTDIIHEISICYHRHQTHAIFNAYLYPVEMTAKPQQIVEHLNKYPTVSSTRRREIVSTTCTIPPQGRSRNWRKDTASPFSSPKTHWWVISLLWIKASIVIMLITTEQLNLPFANPIGKTLRDVCLERQQTSSLHIHRNPASTPMARLSIMIPKT